MDAAIGLVFAAQRSTHDIEAVLEPKMATGEESSTRYLRSVVDGRATGGRHSSSPVLVGRAEHLARLAGAGLTSSRIASRLFLSPTTVDHHLARALRKLGLASRKELVAARDAEAASRRAIPR